MIPTPLQVVLCRQVPEGRGGGGALPAFLDAADRAFKGRGAGNGTVGGATDVPSWVAGTELRNVAFREFEKAPTEEPRSVLDTALHTLVVAWVDEDAVRDAPQFVQWLGKTWQAVDRSAGRHALLLGVPDERLRSDLINKAHELGEDSLADCQMRTWESLGESAARPALVALRALEKARAALCQGLDRSGERLQLFISHAKNDGLSLAESLRHSLREIRGLQTFYDAQDIESGSNWKQQLRQGVESSVLLAVRTDQYDDRTWCVQEVAWADAAGVPIVVVEARSELFHPPSSLTLESSPWIRVPDGSLTRIVFCALRENLRLLLMRRGICALGPEIAGVSEVLPRTPTWDSLDGALGRLEKKTGTIKYVVYPDPKLPRNTCEALDRFVDGRNAPVRVVNYGSLIADPGVAS